MKTLAEKAFWTQGPKEDCDNPYVGHDTFQNGSLIQNDAFLYTAGWSENWGSTSGFSGYLTDQFTIDKCLHDSVLNTNELDSLNQTKLSNLSTNKYNEIHGIDLPGDFQAHNNVSAYKVNYDRLDETKESNPFLHERLTNPDGLTPNSDGIKCAYGTCEANTHNGIGGGHQYYIEPNTFREGVKEGVFEYSPDHSYSTNAESGLNPAKREDIPYEKYNSEYAKNLKTASETEDKNTTLRQHERERLGISESDQINSQTAKGDHFLAEPSDAYQEYFANQKDNEPSLSDNKENAENEINSDQHTNKEMENGESSKENEMHSQGHEDDLQNTESQNSIASNNEIHANESVDNEHSEINSETDENELADSNLNNDNKTDISDEHNAEDLMETSVDNKTDYQNEYDANELYADNDGTLSQYQSDDYDVHELMSDENGNDNLQTNEYSAEELTDSAENYPDLQNEYDAQELCSDNTESLSDAQNEEYSANELSVDEGISEEDQSISTQQDDLSSASTETESIKDTSTNNNENYSY